MEGYLKKTHHKLLKIRERYILMKTAKEIAPVFAWATATIGFSLIIFWGYAVNRLSKMGILFLALSPVCWAFSLFLKCSVEKKKREIMNEISSFWPSGIMFIFALIALRFWLKNPNPGAAFFIVTLGFGSLTFLGAGIETCLASSTLIFKRKYGEHFTQEEANLLFKNFRLPLCKSWFGTKVKKFENELDKENFDCKMKSEALCQRVEFFLENEVSEELRKEKEKIEKLQEGSVRHWT